MSVKYIIVGVANINVGRSVGKRNKMNETNPCSEIKASLELYPKPKTTTDLWALVAIDHKGCPALIKYGPVEFWDGMMMDVDFVDVFDAETPKKAGLYRWSGSYKPNQNVGRPMPNGEVDDWPGVWDGEWEEKGIGW